MSAVHMMQDMVNYNKALLLCGISKNAMVSYPQTQRYSAGPRSAGYGSENILKKPAYGTRCMAVQVSKKLNCPVNRKANQRILRLPDWSEPARSGREIIRADKKLPHPNTPNQFWESGMSCIWCGMDCWELLLQRNRCLHQVMAGICFVE